MSAVPEGLGQLHLGGTAADLKRLAGWLAELFTALEVQERDRFRVDVALTEVVSNIVTHTPEGAARRGVTLSAAIAGDDLRVTILDGAPPFDPLSAPIRPLPETLELASPGGLGLVLIRRYCDEASYARVEDCNQLTLAFRLDRLPGRPMTLSPELCRTHPLLRALPDSLAGELFSRCEQRELSAGDVLLQTGARNRTLHFVLSGKLRIHLPGESTQGRLFANAGEIIGEMSIIEGQPVFARVTAETETCVLAMPESFFWERYCPHPVLMPALLQSLIGRMRRTNTALQEALEQRIRYELLQRELESAARIQTGILPGHQPLLESPLVDVHPCFKPARTVGGDFFDAIAINRHRLAVAIGDVSGKGMPAALFMMRTVSLLRMILLRHRDPARILPELNRQLCQANEECMFVTLAVLILDTDTGELTYLNAGHNPVLVASGGGPFEVWDAPAGTLLGVEPGAVFTPRQRVLAPKDAVLLYTDGVTEAENSRRAMFGLERLKAAVSDARHRHSAAGLIDGLEQELAEFVQDAPQSDDVTALALIYGGALLPDGTPWSGKATRPPFSQRGHSQPQHPRS